MTDTRELESQLRSLARAEHSDLSIAEEAADALAAMRWIPVAERLPKEGERVLIWFEWGPRGNRVEFGGRVNGHWRPDGGNGNFDDSVNWWMPLPAAPKE